MCFNIGDGIDLFFSERYCSYRNAASIVGVLWLSWMLFKLLKTIAGDFCAFYLAPWGISRTNLKKYGEWAVVTGGSEGIGRGYALELARQGLNVVIMSRSKDKLQKVADEIKQKYSREVRVISVDFSEGQTIYSKLADDLKDLDIGVLVNNVGVGYVHPELLHEYSAERFHTMLEINCQCMVQMVKVVLPNMVDKKKGVIVNISSCSGGKIPPMLTVYAASKSFVDSFSLGLHKEYAGRGITVQCVAPFVVATALNRIRRTNILVPDGVKFARAAVATIGIKKFTHGCLAHEIQGYVFRRVPSLICNPLTFMLMKGSKAKYLREKAKESKAE